ncbi:MAG: TonB-dependent receptor [Sphingobium sp.]
MIRNLHSKSVFRGVSLIAVMFAATPAIAQDDSGDIVVTARRVEERLQDVPISITVFNQAQLSNRNVVSAGDLAAYTPSLAANGRWGAESTSYAIRGFVQEGPTSPSVGTYFAEVVAPRVNGGTTSGNGAGVGQFFDLANVQVLKGPQGTLQGRNTTGGSVLLVPQKPTGRFEGYIEGSLGNYDMQRLQGVVNIPVLDTLRVRIGVDHQDRDGYLRNVSSVGPRDFGDVGYTAVRFSTVADLTPNLENYFIGTYSISNTNGTSTRIFSLTPARGNVVSRPIHAANLAAVGDDFYKVANGNPLAGQRIQQWQLINTTTWKASDLLTVKNIVSYAEFRQDQALNNNGDDGFALNPANPFYSIAVAPQPGSHNASQSTFTEEFQIQGHSANDSLTYQAGAYLELSEPLGLQNTWSPQNINCTDIFALQCSNLSGRGLMQLSSSEYHFRNLGLYTQASYKFTDKLSFTAGFRYTSDVTSGIGRTRRVIFNTPNVPTYTCASPAGVVQGGTSAEIQNNPDLCALYRREASKKPTWLVGLDFKPVDDVLLYGKYARGYRQGSINITSYGLETWKPEKVDLYEIGAKTSFSGIVRGNFNIAAFYNDFSNQQLQIGILGCTTVTGPGTQCPFIASAGQGIANAGKSVIKGVEIDANLRPVEGLNLDFSYAYLDAKLKSLTTIPATPVGFNTLILPTVGGVLPLTPKNKYSVTAGYTLPLDPSVGKITFAATFTHQDSSLGNLSSPIENRTLPAQNLLNLNVSWNSIADLPVDVALFATNVTKEEFFLYTTGDSFGADAYIPNQPRMFGARLKYRFGS